MKRLAAAAFAALLTVTTAAAVSLPARASAKGMWWVPCHKRLLCTHVQVPLDYDDPHGVQISIALAKQPATDPTHRIGSLFINPGGPGESGIGFLADAGLRLFTPQVRARFDIIGFDPRGIDHSTQLQCFATVGAAGRAVPGFFYPDTAKRRATWLADDRKVESACARRGGAILDHMSTADVARDLDRLRAAVGDTALTYNGFSYGSFLGNVYANLFPDRVRAVVLDGVVNPVAWTTGSGDDTDQPFSTRMNSARGALTTLNEFFRLCDAGGSNCALAPHSRQKFFELYERLRAHPVHMGGGTVYDETFLVANTLSVMYESAAWDGFAEYLVYLRHRTSTSTVADERVPVPSRYDRYVNTVEGFPAVACSDSVNPRSPSAWTAAAGEDGLFGPLWTWVSSACAHWPGQDDDRYLGPFTNRTANPVLVVGNSFDPATPYPSAQVVARLLPNSRLLTVHGWGHTSLFLSRCADANIARYLVTSRVPPPGTVCAQDDLPFDGPSASSSPSVLAGVPPRFPVW